MWMNFIGVNSPESNIDETVSRRRPDGIITINNITVGYVEVKPLKELVDTHKINKDLVRLGKFSKTAIDTYRLNACFAIQSIGTNLIFHLVEYVNRYLYLMTELDQLCFPASIEDIPILWEFFDNLLRILRVFEEKCKQNNSRTTIRVLIFCRYEASSYCVVLIGLPLISVQLY
ncbi:hypothetical protein RMCBS344292_17180 [Rhizopus microsporus]|nr:hypothetical protein RMCBS344292_17180 [Rhizopus microsporus]